MKYIVERYSSNLEKYSTEYKDHTSNVFDCYTKALEHAKEMLQSWHEKSFCIIYKLEEYKTVTMSRSIQITDLPRSN